MLAAVEAHWKPMAAKTLSVTISVGAAALLGAWLIVRLQMGLAADVPLGGQLFRFTAATILMAPSVVLVLAQAKPEWFVSSPRVRTHLALAGAALVWLFVGFFGSALAYL
jgi:hypothetical protein